MSRVNIRYERTENRADSAEYSATSPDFGDGVWEEIARITFDKCARTYSFVPKGRFALVTLVPPNVYGLPEREREAILSDDYPDARYGGWTGYMHRWATKMLETSGWEDQTNDAH